jgi:hypothetical protein
MLFGFCLIGIWFSFLVIFNLPFSLIIVALERFAGINPASQISMLIYKFGEGISATVAWPFIIGSITLFIIDCKIRYEGLDLKNVLLKERRIFHS